MRIPEATGVKVAPSVQLWDGVSTVVVVQVVPEDVKSLALAPVMDTPVRLKFALPMFVSVALITALVVPTIWLPNAMFAGLSKTPGPVPTTVNIAGADVPAVFVTVTGKLPAVARSLARIFATN